MEVKGTAIDFMSDYVRNVYGAIAAQEWIDSLSPESRKIFTTPVVPLHWYPVNIAIAEPTRKVCELFWKGDVKGAWDMGRYSADFALTTTYQAFTILDSIEEMAKKEGHMLMNIYRPCVIETVEIGPEMAHFKITDFVEWDQIIEARICGFLERCGEIMAATDVKVSVPTSMARGNDSTELVITWHRPDADAKKVLSPGQLKSLSEYSP